MRATEERVLLRGVLAGDPISRRRFVERYGPYLRVCVQRTFLRTGFAAARQDVEDMVGDIWVSLFEDGLRVLRLYDPARSSLALWLGIIARNKTIDRIRTTHPCTLATEEDLRDRAGEDVSPTSRLEDEERWSLLGEAVQRLSASDRKFLEALYLHDCPPHELARELGIHTVSVYTRRAKIQGKLARQVRRLIARRRLLAAPLERAAHTERA
jgi:RNA polymerase sigma factor (sigma-70 family)